MLDHVIVTVSDFTRSIAFYAQAIKPLGITDFLDYKGQDGHPDLKGFGNGGRFFFWLKEGRPNPDAVHFGFVAKSHAEVNAFFVAAIAAGGRKKLHRRPSCNIILTITQPGYSTPTVTTLRLSTRPDRSIRRRERI